MMDEEPEGKRSGGEASIPPPPLPDVPPVDWEDAEAECGPGAGGAEWLPPPVLPHAAPPARRRANVWAFVWAGLAVAACVSGKRHWQEGAQIQGKVAALSAGNQALLEKIGQERQQVLDRKELLGQISLLDGKIAACQKENAELAEELRRYGRQESPMALRDQVQRLEREKDRLLRARAAREELAAQAGKPAAAQVRARSALTAPKPFERLEADTPVAHGDPSPWLQDPQGWEAGIRQAIYANFLARTNGDAEMMRSIFADAVCYQYNRYRTVSQECVMQDIVEGWDKWPVRSYELLQAGVNGDSVEIIFRYELANPITRASTSGYSKESWTLDENGKIVLWEESVSRKSRPRLDAGYRTIKMK